MDETRLERMQKTRKLFRECAEKTDTTAIIVAIWEVGIEIVGAIQDTENTEKEITIIRNADNYDL